jgi:hypothetical protein
MPKVQSIDFDSCTARGFGIELSNCVKLTINKVFIGFVTREYAAQVQKEYNSMFAQWQIEMYNIEIEPWFIEGEF